MKLFAVLFILLFVSGCTTLGIQKKPDEGSIKSLLSQNKFSQAFTEIEQLPDDFRKSNTITTLFKQARIMARDYEVEILAEAEQLETDNKLAQALHVLNEALFNYSEGKEIRVKQINLNKKFTQQMNLLEARVSMEKSDWLVAELKFHTQMMIKDPSDLSAASNVDNVKSKMETIATDLVACGIHALRDNDHNLAESCLGQAKRLSTSDAVQISIKNLEVSIAQYYAEKRQQKLDAENLALKQEELIRLKNELARKKQMRELLAQSRSSLKDRDFNQAKNYLDEARTMPYYKLEVAAIEKLYNKRLSEKLNTELQRGIRLYKRGQVKDAQKIWATALSLKPDHLELKNYLARANRVLQKLSELRSDAE